MKIARFGRLYDDYGRSRAVPSWDDEIFIRFIPRFYTGTSDALFVGGWLEDSTALTNRLCLVNGTWQYKAVLDPGDIALYLLTGNLTAVSVQPEGSTALTLVDGVITGV